jgi:hypothetical protein
LHQSRHGERKFKGTEIGRFDREQVLFLLKKKDYKYKIEKEKLARPSIASLMVGQKRKTRIGETKISRRSQNCCSSAATSRSAAPGSPEVALQEE